MLRIHLYGGLLCAPYLIIFGFSSLHFNHHYAFVEAGQLSKPVEWQQALTLEPVKDNEAMATSVRNSLGLIGWTIPGRMKRDAAGDLEFTIERPGKSYTIKTVLKDHQVRVEERRKSIWTVVNALHALERLPNSKFTSYWGFYTEVCTAFVLFAAVSGVYLWLNSRRERWIGFVTLLGAVVLSVGVMIYAMLRG
jgi:hypothetical protein